MHYFEGIKHYEIECVLKYFIDIRLKIRRVWVGGFRSSQCRQQLTKTLARKEGKKEDGAQKGM